VVECLPLYSSVELLRDLSLGIVGPGLLAPVAYLAVMGAGSLVIAQRRLTRTSLWEQRLDALHTEIARGKRARG
jgi:hypothetical protein